MQTVRVMAITNHKGGTAKTTSTVQLAAALAGLGRKVLVIDLDAQCDASNWLGYQADDANRTSLDVVLENCSAREAIVETANPNLSLIPAEEGLRDISSAFTQNPGQYHVLAGEVRDLSEFDYVLLDCPGDTGDLTTSALIASTEILVAVAAGSLELRAVVAIEGIIDRVCRRLNPTAKIDHLLVGRVDRSQRIDADIIDALRHAYPESFLRTWIPKSVKVSESYNVGRPVTEYAPSSTAARAYVDAAREIDARGEK